MCTSPTKHAFIKGENPEIIPPMTFFLLRSYCCLNWIKVFLLKSTTQCISEQKQMQLIQNLYKLDKNNKQGQITLVPVKSYCMRVSWRYNLQQTHSFRHIHQPGSPTYAPSKYNCNSTQFSLCRSRLLFTNKNTGLDNQLLIKDNYTSNIIQ